MPTPFPLCLGLGARRLTWAIALSAALSLLGCSDGTGPGVNYTLAKARWEQREPPRYRYTLHRSCFCLDAVSMPVIIEVEDGAVISRRYEWTNAEVTTEYFDDFPTVDGLFDILAEAIEADPYLLHARFHRTYGYPMRIDLDYDRQMVDDEVTYTVRDFTVLAASDAASSRH